MIENRTELQTAARHLVMWQEALRQHRDYLAERNPWLLGVTEKAYQRRIETLQRDIAAYLNQHPEAVSLILPPADCLDDAFALPETAEV